MFNVILCNCWDGTFYNQRAILQHQEALRLIDSLGLFEGQNILDVGCGDGFLSHYMAQKGATVLGVDASDSMMYFAQKKYGGHCLFRVMDARRMPFEKQFDIVTCFMCLHWIEHQAQALSNMHSALKDGGKLVMRVTYDDYPFCEPIAYVIRQPEWRSYFENFPVQWVWLHTNESIIALLEQLSYENIKVVDRHSSATFADINACAQWLKTFLPHIACVPQEKQEHFLYAILEKYLSMNNFAIDEPIKVKRHWLEIVAHKD